MTGIITAEQIHALNTGLKANFKKGLTVAEPQYSKIATEIPSSNKSEDYAQLSSWPQLKKWTGDRQLAKLSKSSYTITNEKYESSIVVDRDDVEDDSLGLYSVQAQMIGDEVALFPDSLCFPLLVNAFTEKCYDGQFFFDKEHPVGSSTVSNIVGTGEETNEPWFLLDASKPLKPLIYQKRRAFDFKSLDDMNSDHVVLNDEFVYAVDGRGNAGFGFWQMAVGSKAPLTKENLNKARALMRSFKSDNDTPLRLNPTILVIGGDNEAIAEDLILTEKVGGTSNTLYKKFELLTSPYVTQ